MDSVKYMVCVKNKNSYCEILEDENEDGFVVFFVSSKWNSTNNIVN